MICLQPTIVCTAAVPGMIYLNGRFAGEASRERPLYAPVPPGGATYIEYRPLRGAGGLARRCVFSGGAPLAESLEHAGGMSCVAWPGGVLEAEFSLPQETSYPVALEGLNGILRRGMEGTALLLDGLELSLPEGALPPQLLRSGGASALLGEIEGGGQYLASLPQGPDAPAGLVLADRIDPADGGLFSAIVSLNDSVGHGRLEQWLLDSSGLRQVSSESVWAGGAPRWPGTAEGAMIAAVEAALAGLPAEADGYLSPALAGNRPLDAIGEICELCVPMKYGLPGERPCVGLLKSENAHLATVRPLYYRAGPSGGLQGPWQVEELWLE